MMIRVIRCCLMETWGTWSCDYESYCCILPVTFDRNWSLTCSLELYLRLLWWILYLQKSWRGSFDETIGKSYWSSLEEFNADQFVDDKNRIITKSMYEMHDTAAVVLSNSKLWLEQMWLQMFPPNCLHNTAAVVYLLINTRLINILKIQKLFIFISLCTYLIWMLPFYLQ